MKDFRVCSAEVRSVDREGKRVFVGTALRYGDWSELIGGQFRERFLAGAFRECLAAKPDIIASIDHNFSKLLGRTASGTLSLREDDTGLYAECVAPDTSYARDLAASIARKDISGMSFTFDIDKPNTDDRWFRNEAKEVAREVIRATLFEVAWVVMPAYPTTDAALRSMQRACVGSLRDRGKLLDLLSKS